jgi:hypothetical protein
MRDAAKPNPDVRAAGVMPLPEAHLENAIE